MAAATMSRRRWLGAALTALAALGPRRTPHLPR